MFWADGQHFIGTGRDPMNMQRREFLLASTAMGALAIAAGAPALAQPQARLSPASNAPSAGEWKSYGGDLGSNRYAALDQINNDNFNPLETPWPLNTDPFGAPPEIKFEGTPLMPRGRRLPTLGPPPPRPAAPSA